MAGELVASAVVKELVTKLGSWLGSEIGLLWSFNDDLKYMKSTLESIEAVLNDAERRSFKEKSVLLWLKKLKAAAYDIEDMLDELPTQNRLLKSPAHKLKGMRKRLDKIAEERSRYKLITEEVIGKEVIEERKTSSVVFKDEVLGRDQDVTQIINRLLMSTTTNESTPLSIIPIVGIGGLGKTTLAQLIYNDGRMVVFQPRIWVNAYDLKVEKLIDAILSLPEAHNTSNLTDFNAKMTRAKEILEGKRYLIVLDDVWNKDIQKWEDFKQVLHSGKRESRIIVTTRSEEVGLAMRAEMSHKLKSLPDDVCLELFERRAFESAGPKDNNLASIGKEIVKKCQGVPLTANSLGGVLFEKGEAAWKKVRDSDLWKVVEGEGSSSENNIIFSLNLSYQHMPSAVKLCFVYCSSYPKAFKLDKDILIQQWIAQRFIKTKDETEALQIGDEYINCLLSMSFLEEEKCKYEDAKTYMKMHDLVYDLARWVAGDEVSILDATESGKANAMECRYASVINSVGLSEELGKTLPRKVRALHFQDCTSLPKGYFSYTKCLTVLDFISCSIDELPTSVYKLKQLRYLRLPDDLKKIDDMIGELWTLERLIVTESRSIDILPKSIGNLHNLIYLEINACHSLSSIPSSIESLQRLNSLKLVYCRHFTSIPESIGKLHNLIDLDLSYSYKLLELPDSIGGLQKLNSLKLYDCHNLKSLPESLGNLTTLRTLDIRKCAMLDQDKLSKAICNMKHLGIQIQSDEPPKLLEFDTSALKLHFTNGLEGHVDYVVRHVADAKRINLKERGGSIKSLTYQCGGHKYREAAEAMLEALQPHQNLQELWIDDYEGSMFPSWMRSQIESFLPNLVNITLEGISNCEHLPVLGQLPKLEEIVIEDMGKIRRISEEELCGARNTTASASFPSVKRLKLSRMDELDEWVTAAMAGDDGERGASLFPCLEALAIRHCRKLRRIHSCILPSLKRLKLEQLRDLEEWVTAAMAGDDGERGASLFPCLEDLTIRWCRKLRRIHPCMPPSVKRLVLEGMEDLEEWVTAAMAGDDGERGASLFPCLEELTICHYSKLRIWVCIPSLRRLSLIKQDHLPLQPHQNLQELLIDDYGGSMFPSWMMSQMESFLPNLVKITLTGIRNCEHLPVLGQLPKLEEIFMWDMPKIRRISEEELCGARNTTAGASFPSLKRLELGHMDELEEWVTAAMAGDDGERGASLFPCLENLSIKYCSNLRKIHPCIPPSVKRLELQDVYMLEELVTAAMAGDDGERGASLFPCLEDLTIRGCDKLQTIRPCIPPSVRSLSLSGKHHLTFLDVPEISLLKRLAIYDYGLDIFAESIRRLTSLKTLELRGCKSLTTFPEWLGELSQLQYLEIQDCPLIDRLPQTIQRLTALKRLRISGCSKSLWERTRKETGEDWDKISHIDNVEITSPTYMFLSHVSPLHASYLGDNFFSYSLY